MCDKRKPYKLGDVLLDLFKALREENKDILRECLESIENHTGVSLEKLQDMVKEGSAYNETVAQLRYRIIGDMQKRRINTSFII